MSASGDPQADKPRGVVGQEDIVFPEYITVPPTSPFSEAWGQYRLEVENCRWHKATQGRVQGRWVRALWGGELYQERRSATTGRYVYICSRAGPMI